MPQKHTQHSCVAHPMYPELYKCNSWESTFVEFCVDGINLFVENNFIDSLGPRRDKLILFRITLSYGILKSKIKTSIFKMYMNMKDKTHKLK
jgi:hypothetical protein